MVNKFSPKESETFISEKKNFVQDFKFRQTLCSYFCEKKSGNVRNTGKRGKQLSCSKEMDDIERNGMEMENNISPDSEKKYFKFLFNFFFFTRELYIK